MGQLTPERFSRARRLGVRVPAVLGLVLFSFFFWSVAAEALGIVRSEPEGSPEDPPASVAAQVGASRPGEAVHIVGALGVVAVGAVGLGALALRPERSGSAFQVLGAMTAVLITLPLVGDPDNYGGQAGLIDPFVLVPVGPGIIAALFARPWRHWHLAENPRWGHLLLAVVAAVPAGWYGVGQALMQRNTFPPVADPHHNAHWWAMAVLAFMAVLVTAAAAVPSTGWRLGPGFVAVSAIAVGIASLAASSSASAVSSGWAVAALVWGAAVIWLTVRRAAAQLGAAPDRSAPPRGG